MIHVFDKILQHSHHLGSLPLWPDIIDFRLVLARMLTIHRSIPALSLFLCSIQFAVGQERHGETGAKEMGPVAFMWPVRDR